MLEVQCGMERRRTWSGLHVIKLLAPRLDGAEPAVGPARAALVRVGPREGGEPDAR